MSRNELFKTSMKNQSTLPSSSCGENFLPTSMRNTNKTPTTTDSGQLLQKMPLVGQPRSFIANNLTSHNVIHILKVNKHPTIPLPVSGKDVERWSEGVAGGGSLNCYFFPNLSPFSAHSFQPSDSPSSLLFPKLVFPSPYVIHRPHPPQGMGRKNDISTVELPTFTILQKRRLFPSPPTTHFWYPHQHSSTHEWGQFTFPYTFFCRSSTSTTTTKASTTPSAATSLVCAYGNIIDNAHNSNMNNIETNLHHYHKTDSYHENVTINNGIINDNGNSSETHIEMAVNLPKQPLTHEIGEGAFMKPLVPATHDALGAHPPLRETSLTAVSSKSNEEQRFSSAKSYVLMTRNPLSSNLSLEPLSAWNGKLGSYKMKKRVNQSEANGGQCSTDWQSKTDLKGTWIGERSDISFHHSGISSSLIPEPPSPRKVVLPRDLLPLSLYEQRRQQLSSIGRSSEEVLAEHNNNLSSYEQSEVLRYKRIYYTGKCAKKIPAVYSKSIYCSKQDDDGYNNKNNSSVTPEIHESNFGFDDEHSDYKIVLNDHIQYRYQIIGMLGEGSFGKVVKAKDWKTGHFVAIKIIKNNKKFYQQAKVEVDILRTLGTATTSRNFKGIGINHSEGRHCIVKLLDSFSFRSHMALIFELHGMNIYELCSKLKFAPLPLFTLQKIAKQLLNALVYCQKLSIVHCDMKPENVLLYSCENIKFLKNEMPNLASAKTMLAAEGAVDLANPYVCLIDFGSACFQSQRLYTYIQSRYYRAPEIMLGIPYTTAIDMWSLGCMLAEFANGKPLFPGKNEQDQMAYIMSYLNCPPSKLIRRSPKRVSFFDSEGNPLSIMDRETSFTIMKPGEKSLVAFLKSATSEGNSGRLFVDFVRRCLEWTPEKRWKPLYGLRHPWITGVAEVKQTEEEDSMEQEKIEKD